MSWNLKQLLVACALFAVLSCLVYWLSRWAEHANSVDNENRRFKKISWFGEHLPLIIGYHGSRHEYRMPPKEYSWRLLALCSVPLDDLQHPYPGLQWNDPEYQKPFYAGFREWFRLDGNEGVDQNPHLFAVVGEGTAYDELWSEAFWISHSDYGRDNNIELLESLPGDAVFLIDCCIDDIHWMQPFDIEASDYIDCAERHDEPSLLPPPATPFGRHILFLDGEVWLLRESTPSGLIAKFFTIASALEHDRDELLSGYVIRKYKSTRK